VTTEPLSFTGTLTLQDALDLHRYRSRLIVRRPIRWLLSAFSLLMMTIVLVAGFHSHFTWPSYVVLAVLLYFPFGWFWLERVQVARHYRKHPEHYIESTVTLSEDTVAVANANYEMRLRWKQLRAAVITPRGITVLLPPHSPLFWLPQRLFEGNDKREQIIDLAREHNVPIKRMA
jgi:hypothetical protein